MRENINDFLSSVTTQDITFNKNIEMSDLEGNSKIVCSCFCTIKAGSTVSYYFDVKDSEIFNRYKEQIQLEIDKYTQEARELAIKHGVPLAW